MRICIDPGHGLGNKAEGRYDPGAVSDGVTEAAIVMDWANELRAFLLAEGHSVIRTRVGANDPAHVSERAGLAEKYRCEVMISLHCNAANGSANGTETFYRGQQHAPKAQRLNGAVVSVLKTRNRGIKTEASSQHKRLAVMAFQPCFLIELGFIDNPEDRKKLLDPKLRMEACAALAEAITKP